MGKEGDLTDFECSMGVDAGRAGQSVSQIGIVKVDL